MAFVVGQAISDTNALPVRLKSSDEPVQVTSVSTTNVLTKFREAFETFDVINRWKLTAAPDDIILLDGNAAACSYVVISKDPWSAGSETVLESRFHFEMPIDAAVGLSMSQRTIGQEFSVEYVSIEETNGSLPDVAISSISQSTTTLTITTAVPHGLTPGMRVSVFGCSDSRLNYPALVVASTSSPTRFTATAGPMGTIPSLTVGPLTDGFVRYRSALGGAQNGVSMIFENASVIKASFYARAESGDVLPSGAIVGDHSTTVADSSANQIVSSPGMYAFQPKNEYRFGGFVDQMQFSDGPIDSTSQYSNRRKFTQVVPAVDTPYKLRFRAVNHVSLTRPVAEIISASKAGATTATVVCDRPHGLTTSDFVQIFGARDAAAFPALSTAVAVASVIDEKTFTVVWGSAVTATTRGGFVARVNGQIGLQGVVTGHPLATVTCANNQVTLIGSTTWSGVLVGDYVNLIGCRNANDGADLGLGRAYRVRSLAGTTLVLEPLTGAPVANLDVTNCGGAIVKRTDLRISYVCLIEFNRLRVEGMPRPSGDASSALPVAVQGGSLSIGGGQANEDSFAGSSTVIVGGVVRTAALTSPTAGDAIRQTMSVGGLLVTEQHAIPELTWSYAAPAGGIVDSTAAASVKAAAGSNVRNYVDSIHIAHDTLGAATEIVIRDDANGTVLWRAKLQTASSEGNDVHFDPPLRGSANTLLEVATLTAVTGGVYANLQGHTGA